MVWFTFLIASLWPLPWHRHTHLGFKATLHLPWHLHSTGIAGVYSGSTGPKKLRGPMGLVISEDTVILGARNREPSTLRVPSFVLRTGFKALTASNPRIGCF